MKFYGELLVLILLLITNGRILFVKKAKRDALVVLGPVSFLLTILQIISWGLDLVSLLSLVMSILVILTNFHALFRYTESLYVDHYSPAMKFWATVTCTLTIIIIAGAVYFSPLEWESDRIGVQETKLRYDGSFRTGFVEATDFQSAEAIVTVFEKKPEIIEEKTETEEIPEGEAVAEVPAAEAAVTEVAVAEPQTDSEAETAQTEDAVEEPVPVSDVVLFIPDKRGDTQYYKPYLQLLAKEGFIVISGDIYSNDCKWLHHFGDNRITRRMFMVFESIMDNQKFMSQREFYTYNISLELDALEKLITERYGEQCRIYLLSDVMGNTAISDFKKGNEEKISGCFCIDSLPEYKTAGYGFIRATDPLLAKYLDCDRDRDGTNAKQIAILTAMQINSDWGVANDIK